MRIIAGEFGGRRLKVPPGLDTRPTTDRVREALFSMLSPYTPGARVLDLFAGSGSLSLEALSRGATNAVLCEENRGAWDVIRGNVDSLGVSSRVTLHRAEGMQTARMLKEQGALFDLIFLDPPYHKGLLERAIAAVVPLLDIRGRLITESAASQMPGEDFDGLCLTTTRKYGDCRISVYQKNTDKG